MKLPPDEVTLHSFLGMVNYLNRFPQRQTKITQQLSRLTLKDIPFKWREEQMEAFQTVKQEITQMGALKYFDTSKDAMSQTDASKKGLGVVILQDGRPV